MTFFEVVQVAQILASHKLRDVCSKRLPSHPFGPPFLKIMPLFILRNLKRGRRVPSATKLPNCKPQQALLYTNMVFNKPSYGGMASSYASPSVETGK
jgi:hypothetical protein